MPGGGKERAYGPEERAGKGEKGKGDGAVEGNRRGELSNCFEGRSRSCDGNNHRPTPPVKATRGKRCMRLRRSRSAKLRAKPNGRRLLTEVLGQRFHRQHSKL